MTIEEANNRIKKIGWIIHSEYKDFYSPCKLKCKNGHIYRKTPYFLFSKNKNCKYCSGDTIDTNSANERLKLKGLKLINEYNTNLKKQELECLNCCFKITRRVLDVLKYKTNVACPECRSKTTQMFNNKERIKKLKINELINKMNNSNFFEINVLKTKLSGKCKNNHINFFNIGEKSKRIFCKKCIYDICLNEKIEIINENDLNFKVKCKCGYTWNTTPKKIIKGDCCIYCNYEKNKNIRWIPTDEQYKCFLKRRGFIVDSSETIINSNFDIKMKCPNGHDICVPPVRILRNIEYKCAKCCGKAKLTYEDVVLRLKGRDITLLDKNPPNSKDKGEFRCEKCKMTWKTKMDSVLNSKSGCPYCCKRGFCKNKNAFFYIHEIKHISGKIGLKIGITCDIYKRTLMQIKASQVEIKNLFSIKSRGDIIYMLEYYIKQKYKNKFGFFKSSELIDGYTESISNSFYENIVNDVKDYIKKHSNPMSSVI